MEELWEECLTRRPASRSVIHRGGWSTPSSSPLQYMSSPSSKAPPPASSWDPVPPPTHCRYQYQVLHRNNRCSINHVQGLFNNSVGKIIPARLVPAIKSVVNQNMYHILSYQDFIQINILGHQQINLLLTSHLPTTRYALEFGIDTLSIFLLILKRRWYTLNSTNDIYW